MIPTKFHITTKVKMTTRVNMKMSKGKVVNPYDVYTGRACYRGGWELKKSPFHNPYTGKDAVYQYYKYMMADEQKELRKKAKKELKNKKIGCFCSKEKGNLSCHAEVL